MTLLTRNELASSKNSSLIVPISTVEEFAIPTKYLIERNRPKALVMWYYHCLGEVRKTTKLPFIAHMRPAKLLIGKYGWEESALAIRKAVGGKYMPSLWYLLKHPDSNLVKLE